MIYLPAAASTQERSPGLDAFNPGSRRRHGAACWDVLRRPRCRET
jgi:hypothetical protein